MPYNKQHKIYIICIMTTGRLTPLLLQSNVTPIFTVLWQNKLTIHQYSPLLILTTYIQKEERLRNRNSSWLIQSFAREYEYTVTFSLQSVLELNTMQNIKLNHILPNTVHIAHKCTEVHIQGLAMMLYAFTEKFRQRSHN